MGYKHTPWALELDGLNHNEKVVLLCLTSHANNETQRTWVSLSTIARECGYSQNSRTTVRKALRGLREKGVISYEEQRAGTGEKQSSNTYTVHWPSTPGANSTRPPVLTTPGPGAESTTNEEPNEEVLNEEPYSPPSLDGAIVAPPLSSGDDEKLSPAAAADPVGPDWYHSKARKDAIDIIQQTGQLKEQGNTDGYYSGLDALDYHLEVHLHGDFSFLHDYWEIPKDCAHDRHKAATKLNQILHSYIKDEGPLSYSAREISTSPF